MIRQPDFVESDFAMQILEHTKKKKPHDLLEQVRFEEIVESDCIQMLRLGSYDKEPENFRVMEVLQNERIKVENQKSTEKFILVTQER